MSCYLWVEVAGIQDYLFASDNLSEIVGASMLVEDFTSTIVQQSLQSLPAGATMVFSGGGHCLVESPRLGDLKNLARTVQFNAWSEAPGLHLRTYLHQPTVSDFPQAMAELHHRLLFLKAETPKIYYLPPLSVSRVSPETGYPSSGQDTSGREVSLDQWKKSKRYQQSATASDEVEDFDQLVLREGESTIGIVHIDGNDLGRALREQQNSAEELRSFSVSVREAFNQAWNNLKMEIPMSTGVDRKRPDRRPVRKLVQGGDDFTFAATGPFALHWAARFLELLNLPLGKGACAGVAIIKRSTPIQRGFEWAHALCQSAKARRKAYPEKGIPTGSWIDWEIEWREDLGHIHDYRGRKYAASGTRSPSGTGFEFPLCWRPLQVVGESRLHSWMEFQRCYQMSKLLPTGPREQVLHSLFRGQPEAESQGLSFAARRELEAWPTLELGGLRFSLDHPMDQGLSPYADILEASLFFLTGDPS